MSLEGDLQAILAALVSGRCYPLMAPDNVAKPYITFQTISDIQENDLRGFAGISKRRIQVDVYTTTYGATKALAASVKSGLAASSLGSLHLTSQDLYEPEVQLYRVSMDFSMWA